jgi:hypothetical protein
MQAGRSEFETTMIGGVAVLDRMKILDEINRYAWAWDSGEIEEYLDRYAEDGVFEHPTRDGKPGFHKGREEIRTAIQANMDARPTNAYGLQHHFSSPRLEPRGADVQVNAYCAVLRHEFHRTYWPHGPSFRIGTWHATYGRVGDEWRIKHLTVKMWTDTAFNSGIAIQDRQPGMVGTGTPFG